MSKYEQVTDLIHQLHRNYPNWPSTFGPCKNGCEKMARGSGSCADCIEKKIAKITDDPILASKLHHHIQEQARILRVWQDTVK